MPRALPHDSATLPDRDLAVLQALHAQSGLNLATLEQRVERLEGESLRAALYALATQELVMTIEDRTFITTDGIRVLTEHDFRAA